MLTLGVVRPSSPSDDLRETRGKQDVSDLPRWLREIERNRKESEQEEGLNEAAPACCSNDQKIQSSVRNVPPRGKIPVRSKPTRSDFSLTNTDQKHWLGYAGLIYTVSASYRWQHNCSYTSAILIVSLSGAADVGAGWHGCVDCRWVLVGFLCEQLPFCSFLEVPLWRVKLLIRIECKSPGLFSAF